MRYAPQRQSRQGWASFEIRLIPGLTSGDIINDVGAIKDSRCNTSIQICVHVKKLVDQTRYLYKGTYEVTLF